MTYEIVFHPKFYYSTLRSSDKDFIFHRMSYIPTEAQEKVSFEYERIYLSRKHNSARRAANEYLDAIAREYRNQASDKVNERRQNK